jgi:hypothetical protein
VKVAGGFFCWRVLPLTLYYNLVLYCHSCEFILLSSALQLALELLICQLPRQLEKGGEGILTMFLIYHRRFRDWGGRDNLWQWK